MDDEQGRVIYPAQEQTLKEIKALLEDILEELRADDSAQGGE